MQMTSAVSLSLSQLITCIKVGRKGGGAGEEEKAQIWLSPFLSLFVCVDKLNWIWISSYVECNPQRILELIEKQ